MRYWTGAEEKILRELYPTHSDAQIANILGRPCSSVRTHRCVMGLYRGRKQVRTRVAPDPQEETVRSREYLDCMDWPYPFVKPKTRKISL